MDYVLISRDDSRALEHRSYKYIKREWKNGHWVYWYNVPGTKNTISGRHADPSSPERSMRLQANHRSYTENRALSAKDRIRRIQYDLNDPRQSKWREHDQQRLVEAKRDYGANMQELSRLEEEKRNKKLSKRAAKWLKQRKARFQQAKNKALTTKNTLKDPKTGKTIKSWTTPGWRKR